MSFEYLMMLMNCKNPASFTEECRRHDFLKIDGFYSKGVYLSVFTTMKCTTALQSNPELMDSDRDYIQLYR